jgi:polyisoprenyl-teichoic acid--peptidoglycan teichoic acid transferase
MNRLQKPDMTQRLYAVTCVPDAALLQSLAHRKMLTPLTKAAFILSLYNCALMLEKTQPTRRMDRMQALRPLPARRRSRLKGCCMGPLLLLVVALLYFFAPLRTNILLLGTDDSPERGSVGRTDTIILATVVPLKPYVGMLSIPRDLWVTVPGVGEQRINTAYFFAESTAPGSGSQAALQTIRENFGVPVRYYAVVHMTGLTSIVDALGGVDIQLDSSIAGFPPGVHHLNGEQALFFVRERSSSDDFGRMVRSQILLSAIVRKSINPSNWTSLPELVSSFAQVIDTNIPFWQWPRLLFALMRAFVFGLDSQTITRDMVVPFQTSQGAQVLAPNWEAIEPLLSSMFGG